jgi:hypothetical protein
VPQAGAWWASHRISQCAHATTPLHHPVVGPLTLRFETLSFPADPDHALGLFTAEPGSSSAQALPLPASWTAPEARAVPEAPGLTGPGEPGRP